MMNLREGDKGVILKMLVVMLMTTLWCCLMLSAIMMEMVMEIKIILEAAIAKAHEKFLSERQNLWLS